MILSLVFIEKSINLKEIIHQDNILNCKKIVLSPGP